MKRLFRRVIFLGFVAMLRPACGDGAGATLLTVMEDEPNDTIFLATSIPPGGAGQGSLAVAADVDYWSFTATAGQYVSIEIYALRFDQAAWRLHQALPIMSLFASDGTTPLLRHDHSQYVNLANPVDLDFPLFKILATGSYYLRVQSLDSSNLPADGGKYLLRVRPQTITGTLVTEAEPIGGVNNTPATAQPISANTTVFGFYLDSDPDFYSFTIATPTIIHVETLAIRYGRLPGSVNYRDNRVRLYSTDGITVLQDNDDNIWFDGGVHYLLTTPGTYFVEVTQTGFTASTAYWLTYTTESPTATAETEVNDTFASANPITYGAFVTGGVSSVDTDFFSFSAQAGDQVMVKRYDAANREGSPGVVTVAFLESDGTTVHPSSVPGAFQQIQSTIFLTSGTHYLRVTTAGGPCPYALQLILVRSAQAESEPNDTNSQAGTLDVNGRAAGVISVPGDEDRFQFTAAAGEVVTFQIFAGKGGYSSSEVQGTGSSLVPRVSILDGGGATLASSARPTISPWDDALSLSVFEPTLEVTFVAPAAATYFVGVKDLGGAGSATSWYVLERR
jgi:hypothetical protein